MANQSTGTSGSKNAPASVPIPRSKRGVKGFFAEVSREIKKVHWPTKAETNRLTGVVFAVCALAALVLLAMSMLFDNFVSLVTKGRI